MVLQAHADHHQLGDAAAVHPGVQPLGLHRRLAGELGHEGHDEHNVEEPVFQSNVTNYQFLLQGAYIMDKSIKVLKADLAESPITQGRYAGPTIGTERILAEVLAEVVRVECVSIDSHFFEDLGANSLVMAQFCARVR